MNYRTRGVAPGKGIRIPESWKFLLVESGILGFGIWKYSSSFKLIRKTVKPQNESTETAEKKLRVS